MNLNNRLNKYNKAIIKQYYIKQKSYHKKTNSISFKLKHRFYPRDKNSH